MQYSTSYNAPKPAHKIFNWLSHIVRTLLGLTFIFSGFVKAIDPLGTTYKIEDYLKAFGGFFTDLLPWAETAAFILIAVEFVLGICLVLNVRTSVTSWLSLLFYLVMTPLTLYIAIANPVSDCGCFGDALVITNWQTFWKNVILLTLVIILLRTRKYTRPLFVWQAELGIASIAVMIVAGVMMYSLYHLPFKDFRPYKVGNHIPTLMEFPEGAEPDQYAITFVYAKDGHEEEFTLQDYPKGDSTWTFVRQNSKLIKKGYEPPIHDFELLTTDYEDITYDVLESEIPVTLVVMYDLQKSDMTQMDKVRALYADCQMKGEPFYILTGSGEDEVEQYSDLPFCYCDPVTLKTIVRANPGVIVVRNGYIIEKYNLRNR